MNQFKQILLTAVATIGIFSTTIISCNTDACKNVVCNNGGTCLNGTCNCTSGYEGTNCSTLSRAKFLVSGTSQSTWKTLNNTQDNCLSTTSTGYTQYINAGSLANQLIVTNTLGYLNMTTTLNVSGLTFTQSGTATSNAVTISNFNGTIDTTVTPHKITFTYTSADATKTINCSGYGLQQ